jgi:oligoribonuclease
MHLIFIDLETTGLLWDATNAEILELALVAVDARTLQEVAHYATPLNAKCYTGEWHPRVVEMHQNSGLLQELRGPKAHLKHEAGGLPYVHQAEQVALQFMAQYAPGQSSPMCGANVGAFDRQWVRRFMPKLDEAFHYRCLDTNAAFLVESFVFGLTSSKGVTTHRALDDARQSVDTLRKQAATLFEGYRVQGRAA